jgi:hypothetical protein
MRMTADVLNLAAARLEQIRAEEESLHSELQRQVQEFGFTPPRADKSKRLLGTFYRLTRAESGTQTAWCANTRMN